VPSHLDQLICYLISSDLCTINATAESNLVPFEVIDKVMPTAILTGGENYVCSGSEVTLTISATGQGNNPEYNWFVNDQNITGSGTDLLFVPVNGDVVRCELLSDAQCASPSLISSNSMIMQVSDPIVAAIETVQPATCGLNNGVATLSANGGAFPLEFSIDDGSTWLSQAVLSNLTAGNYALWVKDAGDCLISEPVEFDILEEPMIEIDELVSSKCHFGQSDAYVDAYVSGSLPILYSLDQSNWQSENRFEQLEAGNYTLYAKDVFGCITNKSFEILIQYLDFEPGIPNAFRPASIPPNNTFKPVFGPIAPIYYRMLIYNSWGELVFETEDCSNGWDGMFRGAEAPMGGYVYKIEFSYMSFESSKEFYYTRSGSVLLVR
jgi:hypothetical protein